MKNTLTLSTNIQLSFPQLVELARQLPARQKKKLANILTNEEETTKEEILEGIREGLQDVKLYKEGKIELRTLDEFLNDV